MYAQYMQWVSWKKHGLCHCVYIFHASTSGKKKQKKYVVCLKYRAVHRLAAAEQLLPTDTQQKLVLLGSEMYPLYVSVKPYMRTGSTQLHKLYNGVGPLR
jgi:hypothetical protein